MNKINFKKIIGWSMILAPFAFLIMWWIYMQIMIDPRVVLVIASYLLAGVWIAVAWWLAST